MDSLNNAHHHYSPPPRYMIPRRPVGSAPSRPAIGIRRTSAQSIRANAAVRQTPASTAAPIPANNGATTATDFAHRRRSSSEPRPYNTITVPDDALVRSPTRPESRAAGRGDPRHQMTTVAEENSPLSRRPAGDAGAFNVNAQDFHQMHVSDEAPPDVNRPRATRSQFDRFTQAGRARRRADSIASQTDEYDPELVNLLDVIDPEVSTLSTLTNVQNSLFVPDLGRFVNRRPTYNLTAMPSWLGRPNTARTDDERLQAEVDEDAAAELDALDEVKTIDSRLSESHYAVLPHGVKLEGWSQEEKEQLNDHVRHMLHSRRAAFRRSMKGFGQYVRRPLGFFITLYATLITLFGFAWVLFLIGWVNLGAKRDYVINVVDNVLVALFAIMGDGLIPFRLIDTYHMIFIAHYHHLTWRIRKQQHLPKLPNHNDLPEEIPGVPRHSDATRDLESATTSPGKLSNIGSSDDGNEGYYSVLNMAQQRKLEHHQKKFSRSHTFYKPHETATHFAFPLRLLVAIVVILDFHSIFQVALGVCTWSIPYQTRPFTLTTVILCCSITCNITGGVLISIGDRRTRKKEVRERMFRQALTEDAIRRMQKEKKKEGGLEAVPEVRDERGVQEVEQYEKKKEAAHV